MVGHVKTKGKRKQPARITTRIDGHILGPDGTPRKCINIRTRDGPEYLTFQEFMERRMTLSQLIFTTLTGRDPREEEIELLERTLNITSIGLGGTPPSVMVPRLCANVNSDVLSAVNIGLAQVFLTSTDGHLGIMSIIMKQLEELRENHKTKEWVVEKLRKREKILGWGHPFYKKDPRPIFLEEEVAKVYPDSDILRVYRIISKILEEEKGLHPGVGAGIALAYSSMGFGPEHSTYLFGLGRTLSTLRHVLEQIEEPAFSLTQAIDRREPIEFEGAREE